ASSAERPSPVPSSGRAWVGSMMRRWSSANPARRNSSTARRASVCPSNAPITVVSVALVVSISSSWNRGRTQTVGATRVPSLTGRTDVLNSAIGRLRLVGYAEGVSFLLLLGVAMPLKYAAGMPEVVFWVGLAHGILFMLYVAAVAHAYRVGE